ncbi:MAG: hypothetical protein IKY54_07375 [Muribaculaceae bacterium]|nr:hypothetical protein [Muribaculaceae bacterium]
MKTFKFLRILFLAIISLSIISCTNNNEDDDLGSKSPMPDKGYKKLVQMNIKYDDNEEERCYFNYDENGTLTSLDLEYYEDGFFDGEETYYIKWDNNIISYSEDGVEWEDLYQISNDKAVKALWEGATTEFEYDSNDHMAIEYSGSNRNKTIYTWKEEKLIKQTYNETYSSEYTSYSSSESTEYLYSSHSSERCNGFFPNMAEDFGELYEFCAAPWIFGMEQQELPQKIEKERIYSNTYGDYTNTSKNRTEKLFTYTFYGDGYLKTCTEKRTDIFYEYSEEETETTVYEYFWQ